MKLDMAKEISMIQRTEKGKLARQYFIETEKKYREQNNQMPMSVEDLIIMQAQKLKDFRLQQEKLEKEQKRQNDKVVYLETEITKETLKDNHASNDYIARKLNLFSMSDKPHFQFVDAVARELRIYNNTAGYEDEYVKAVRDASMGGITKNVVYYSEKGVELISNYIEDWFKPKGKFYVRGISKGKFNESSFELGGRTYKFNKKTYEKYK